MLINVNLSPAMVEVFFYPSRPLSYFFLALIVIWLLVWLGHHYRSMRLAGLASELSLRLFVKDPLDLPQRYGQLQLFKLGHARRARNVMIGIYQGRQMRIFDFLCETGLGLDRRTRQASVVMINISEDFPPLLARPAEASPYNLTGLPKIDLPQADAEQGYEVFCENADLTLKKLGPEVFQGLKDCRRAILELKPGVLALYWPRRVQVAEYRQLRKLASRLAEHFSPAET